MFKFIPFYNQLADRIYVNLMYEMEFLNPTDGDVNQTKIIHAHHTYEILLSRFSSP